MQQIPVYVEAHEKLDFLLTSLLSTPNGSIGLDDFGKLNIGMEEGELVYLRDKLIYDGLLCVKAGSTGLEIALTEEGIKFIVFGGYTSLSVTPPQVKRHGKRKLWRFLILYLFCLAILIYLIFLVKK